MKVSPANSALVIPFGKHKGMTVAELIERDPAYAQWISNQNWVAERFAELHAAILQRGAASDDSPEHNAIQVRFLRNGFLLACLKAAIPDQIMAARGEWISTQKERAEAEIASNSRWSDEKRKSEARKRLDDINENKIQLKTKTQFEYMGVDVLINWWFQYPEAPSDLYGSCDGIGCEIKPTMGDDFPAVMRQMRRLKARMLVVGEYTGRGVEIPEVREMFKANGQTLVFMRDIEAEFAAVRAGWPNV